MHHNLTICFSAPWKKSTWWTRY